MEETYQLYLNSTGQSIFYGPGGHTKGQGNVILLKNIMMNITGHHHSFISLYSFFFGSPHTALSLFWAADMDMDEVIREDMAQAVQIWRKQEWKEDKKI